MASLQAARENRVALGIGLYVSHVACEMAYSTAAFEVTYNGQSLYSKLATHRYPQQGEVAAALRDIKSREHADLDAPLEAS
mmetsp:Transcript_10668/g.36237  ORF Transcript_10668/g.36237 Transcript_10668/m.36237 type:complete len:81 (+) Transcript_10668:532-774(+)